MQTKNKLVSELKKDEIVNDIFVVKNKRAVEEYKNGFRFELRLGDASKDINFKYWGPNDKEAVDSLYDSIKKADVVHVQGRVNEWQEKLEISANAENTITVLKEGEYNPADFVKKTTKNIEELWSELLQFADSIENTHLKNIINYFLQDEAFAEQLKKSPAAMYLHHGWIGGLLEHTVAVTKIADAICTVHQNLNRDLVITGSILHDLGKIEEFNVTTTISPTVEGQLIGHVTILTEKLGKIMDKLQTPEEIRLKVQHMVITHMGEYGSSKTPAFPEAMAVHFADNTDGTLTQMKTYIEEADEKEDFVYNKNLGNLYRK